MTATIARKPLRHAGRPRGRAARPPAGHRAALGARTADRAGWTGPTYYGRPQLKAAPFENPVVGGYIFLAGLSGSAA